MKFPRNRGGHQGGLDFYLFFIFLFQLVRNGYGAVPVVGRKVFWPFLPLSVSHLYPEALEESCSDTSLNGMLGGGGGLFE